jgi:hypothetical protein
MALLVVEDHNADGTDLHAPELGRLLGHPTPQESLRIQVCCPVLLAMTLTLSRMRWARMVNPSSWEKDGTRVPQRHLARCGITMSTLGVSGCSSALCAPWTTTSGLAQPLLLVFLVLPGQNSPAPPERCFSQQVIKLLRMRFPWRDAKYEIGVSR